MNRWDICYWVGFLSSKNRYTYDNLFTKGIDPEKIRNELLKRLLS